MQKGLLVVSSGVRWLEKKDRRALAAKQDRPPAQASARCQGSQSRPQTDSGTGKALDHWHLEDSGWFVGIEP
jgi:hypothetical protein